MLNDFKNLVEVTMYFSSTKICKDFLEKSRWSDGITCPHCESPKKIYKMKHIFKCSECRKQFSVTKGTIFEASPIPLQKWFVAIYIMLSHKKGIASTQLGKDLGITQKSAWFMLQRIRHVLETGSMEIKKLDNVVEVDETYVGGKNKNRHADKKIKGTQGRSIKDKVPVFGMLERGGKVIAQKVSSVGAKELQAIIKNTVERTATDISDEWTAYSSLSRDYKHLAVNHGAGIYVVNDIYTNTIEGFWSILKRGILGIYHNVSPKHIDRYIKEFEFRYNSRHLKENERFVSFFGKLNDCRIEYKELISN